MRDLFVEDQMNQAKHTSRDLRLRELIERLQSGGTSGIINDEIADHLEKYRQLARRIWELGMDEDKL